MPRQGGDEFGVRRPDWVCGWFRARACDQRANWFRHIVSLSHGDLHWLGLEPSGKLPLPLGSQQLRYYQNMAKRSTEKVIPKKPGRPATGRDPVLALRLPPALRSEIESWAKQQNDKPSRSEAIRRLIEFALKAKAKRQNTTGK